VETARTKEGSFLSPLWKHAPIRTTPQVEEEVKYVRLP
jgi:hypothetical protein